MGSEHTEKPWVSFCMSTYKRPILLMEQLEIILKQSFGDFEVVISDNDPACSAENIVMEIGDPRLKYFPNNENLGMIKSFNNSIARSKADYIVMITDDDPIVPEMLEDFHKIMGDYPGFNIYMGCSRVGKRKEAIETFDNQNFVFQILHPGLTTNLLWSSCILKKDILLKIGGVPDYVSLHLTDHAMIALCGNINGGVMINKMYGQFTSHDNNFSKTNINLYSLACTEFYNLITNSINREIYIKNGENALLKHLERWFIVSMFSLRKYFTYQNKDTSKIDQINAASEKVLQLHFMKHIKTKYYLKLIIFYLKRPLILLKIMH